MSGYLRFENVIKNGKYYAPAWKHYGETPTNVMCDRCRKSHLSICIGADANMDLCLNCAHIINEMLIENNSRPTEPIRSEPIRSEPIRSEPVIQPLEVTKMNQNMYKNEMHTYMEQYMFNRMPQIRMAQNMFTKN